MNAGHLRCKQSFEGIFRTNTVKQSENGIKMACLGVIEIRKSARNIFDEFVCQIMVSRSKSWMFTVQGFIPQFFILWAPGSSSKQPVAPVALVSKIVARLESGEPF